MGGGASKNSKEVQDDAPPPPTEPQNEAARVAANIQAQVQARQEKKQMKKDKKQLYKNNQKVDVDGMESNRGEGLYDSDLERQLQTDARVLEEHAQDAQEIKIAFQDAAKQEARKWMKEMQPPSSWAGEDASTALKPEETLELEFVHGYRGWDCGANLFFVEAKQLLYFAGNVGVIMDAEKRSQRHYLGAGGKKSREVASLALHPSGSIVATGEKGARPTIYVWDLKSLATIKQLVDVHENGVTGLAFSKDGTRLVSVDMSPSRTLAVWDWKGSKGQALCTCSLQETPKVFCVAFNPKEDTVVVGGVNFIAFLRAARGGIQRLPATFAAANRAAPESQLPLPSVLCVAFTKTQFSLISNMKNAVEGLTLTGSDTGNIYLWKGQQQMEQVSGAHKGSVYALATMVNGFVSGGKDGRVRMWTNDLEPQKTFDMSAACGQSVAVRALDCLGGQVAVGTGSSQVLLLELGTGQVEGVVDGHALGVYAVAVHPLKPLMASGGDDAVLRLWDMVRNEEWKAFPLGSGPVRALDFSPDGKTVAIGHSTGAFTVVRVVEAMEEVGSGKDREKAVCSVAFSPSNRYLACGSEDCFVDVYDCVNDFDWAFTLTGHENAVRHVDWSADSRFLQSAGPPSELCHWDVIARQRCREWARIRDQDWHSWTLPAGFPVKGLVACGLQTMSVCRSLSNHLVVVANSDSLIRLFRFPATNPDAEEKVSTAHTGPVNCVKFSFNDAHVISCAHQDRSVMQWKVARVGGVEFDGADAEALSTLEDPREWARKDRGEQGRLDARHEKMQAERVLAMNPGKQLPDKQDRKKGKEAVAGIAAGGGGDPADVDLRSVADSQGGRDRDRGKRAAAAIGALRPAAAQVHEEAGIPEQLPTIADEMEEAAAITDSDIEREIEADYTRGPQRRAPAAKKGEEGEEDGRSLFHVPASKSMVPPTKYKRPDDADEVPMGGLQMEFIHGLRTHDTRSSLLYTVNGDVVGLAGAACWVYNIIQHSQRFYSAHTNDVIAIALHPDGQTVATGQAGKKASLCVWDSATTVSKSVLVGFHDHGIGCLAFDASGDRIASVGLDPDHSIAVWEWRVGTKLASATGQIRRILGVAFNPKDDELVTVGVSHVKFWTLQGRLLRGVQGNFTQGDKQQAFTTVAISKKGRIYVGSSSGEIYRWKNKEVEHLENGHTGAVTTLSVCADGLCSGGKDGRVVIWSLALKQLTEFDFRRVSLGLERSRIRSVCWVGKNVLVGTIHNELFEIDLEDGRPNLLLQGHKACKVRGLCAHPSKRMFASGAEDATVRVWDMDSRQQINLKTLEGPVWAVAISLDGLQLVAGLEGGHLQVFQFRNLKVQVERKDRKSAVCCLRFSHNGKFLAAGLQEGFIDLYDVNGEYEWIGTLSGHKSPITALDWSSDNNSIQSTDEERNLFFWDVDSTKQIRDAAVVRDMQWSTWTSVVGWPVQGIVPKLRSPEGINAVCRSPFGDTLASVDDWGMVKLFKFPSDLAGAKHKSYGGHSALIGNVCFSFDQKVLLTSGLVDGLVIQWRFLSSGKVQDKQEEEAEMDDEEVQVVRDGGAGGWEGEQEGVDSDVEAELAVRWGRGESQVTMDKRGQCTVKSARMVTGTEAVSGSSQGGSHLNLQAGVLEYAAQRAEAPLEQDRQPPSCLQLEYIYGYRFANARSSIRYTANMDIAYMAGAVGVVLVGGTSGVHDSGGVHEDKNMQRFYSAHTDDITCLTLHPDGLTVATGQVGKMPPIHVWDSASMKTLSVLKGQHQIGVGCLGFSHDGNKLVSVGLDGQHGMVVWDWKRGEALATAECGPGRVFEVEFNPIDDTVVTCGMQHLRFWSLKGDNQLKWKRAVYGEEGLQLTMLCLAFTQEGLTLTGGQNGHVYLWKAHYLEWEYEEAHRGAIFALASYPAGFVSGGRDGRVKVWQGLDPVKVLDFSSLQPSDAVSVRILALCWKKGHILVGTMTNEIYEVVDGSMVQRCIIKGHASVGGGGGLWALDTHPSQPMFATGGDDCTVRVYKVSARKVLVSRAVEAGVRSLAYHPSGAHIIAGLSNGKLLLMEARKLDTLFALQCSHRSPITDIKFCPKSQSLLAACSMAGTLELFHLEGKFVLLASSAPAEPERGAAAAEEHGWEVERLGDAGLTVLDWSDDGEYIQTDDADRQHKYWHVRIDGAGRRAGLQAVGDADKVVQLQWSPEWHCWSCTGGFNVLGLTPVLASPLGVNAAHVNQSRETLATANDTGLIHLYRFPSRHPGAKHRRFAGHSSNASRCKFTADDRYLISVGSTDLCVFQWEHVRS